MDGIVMNRLLAPALATLLIGTAAFDATPSAQAATTTIESVNARKIIYTVSWNGYYIDFYDDGMIKISIEGENAWAIYPDGSMWEWKTDIMDWTPAGMNAVYMILWILFGVGYVILP
jgi:hypothetical protein